MNSIDSIKVVVIGDSGLGKTPIIKRICNGIYDNNKTIGVDFDSRSFIYLCNTYKIQFWDCAGDARFNSIIRSYYNNTKYICIFFDAENTAFEEEINYWRDELNHNREVSSFSIFYIGVYNYQPVKGIKDFLIKNKYNSVFIDKNNYNSSDIVNPIIELYIEDNKLESNYDINTKLLSCNNESRYKECCFSSCNIM